MNKLLLPCICMALITPSPAEPDSGQTAEHHAAPVKKALAKAGSNAPSLQALFDKIPAPQKPGLAFLLSHMPGNDLKTLSPRLLEDNIALAYYARETFLWGKDIPEPIFLNDVLPYAVLDETRENWRKDFLDLFGKHVRDCKTMEEAVKAINGQISHLTGVNYNTRREKPNQSPTESLRQKMASCTGLAILLIDAFRSVGIPARFAGTASWHDDRGNHSWVEVWMNDRWYITEYYMPRRLDQPWFLANTGKADPGKRTHAVYATSFRQTGESFPMVWNEQSADVPAVNVSQRYIDIYTALEQKFKNDGTHVQVSLRMFKDKAHATHSDDRIAANVDVFEGDLQMDGGRTSGPLQDMNDVLTFWLEKNKNYTFRYQDANGNQKELTTPVKDKPFLMDAYMN